MRIMRLKAVGIEELIGLAEGSNKYEGCLSFNRSKGNSIDLKLFGMAKVHFDGIYWKLRRLYYCRALFRINEEEV